MDDQQLFCYAFLLLSFVSIWMFEQRGFAIAAFTAALVLGLAFEISTAIEIFSVLTIALAIREFYSGRYFQHSYILWLFIILLSWLYFTSGLQEQLSIFDGLWIYNNEEISFYLDENFNRIALALCICFFALKPIGKLRELMLLLRKTGPIFVVSLLIFYTMYSLSDQFIYNPQLNEFWAIWAVSNFIVASMSQEAFFRLLILGNLMRFAKNIPYGAWISLVSSSLIYATSFAFENVFLSFLLFLKGFALGLIFIRCGRIEISALLNCAINFLNIFVFTLVT